MSRTVIYALVNIVLAVLMSTGVAVPDEVRGLFDGIAEHLDALLLAVNGVLVWWLRMKTSQPMNGLLIKRKV